MARPVSLGTAKDVLAELMLRIRIGPRTHSDHDKRSALRDLGGVAIGYDHQFGRDSAGLSQGLQRPLVGNSRACAGMHDRSISTRPPSTFTR